VESSTQRDFERLYRRHHDEIYHFLARELGDRYEAEDITQDAFLNAFRALVRGNAPEQPRPWLYKIAQNVRRRRHRKERVREVPLDRAPERAAPQSDIDPEELVEALSDLPAMQRQALLLREVSGLSYTELADRLNLTEAAVQMLLFRARRALRGTLRPRGTLVLLPLPRLLPWLNGTEAPIAGAAARAAAAAAVAVAVGVGTRGADARLSGLAPDRWAPLAQTGAPTATGAFAASAALVTALPVQTGAGAVGAASRQATPELNGAVTVDHPAVAPAGTLPAAPASPRAPESGAPSGSPQPVLPVALPALPSPALPTPAVPTPAVPEVVEPVAPLPIPAPPALQPPSPLPQVPLPAPPSPPTVTLPTPGK
jgi:RNA polymerase sigma-70 factor (ECF subfamily)